MDGWAEFEKVYSELSGSDKDVFLLFSGGVDPATGHSWCPDCVKGEY